jgi:hypothetical protein
MFFFNPFYFYIYIMDKKEHFNFKNKLKFGFHSRKYSASLFFCQHGISYIHDSRSTNKNNTLQTLCVKDSHHRHSDKLHAIPWESPVQGCYSSQSIMTSFCLEFAWSWHYIFNPQSTVLQTNPRVGLKMVQELNSDAPNAWKIKKF